MTLPGPIGSGNADAAPGQTTTNGRRRWSRRRFGVALAAVAAISVAVAVARSGRGEEHRAGYVGVETAGRALLVACRLFSIEHGGALPPDFPSVLSYARVTVCAHG